MKKTNRILQLFDAQMKVATRKESSDQITPLELARKMVREVPSRLFGKSLLVPGSGYGTFAVAAILEGWPPESITCVELRKAVCIVTGSLLRHLGCYNVVNANFLTWDSQMQFDVVIGNPPYNNSGKREGGTQTSGTSLWIQFLKKVPDLLKPNGWSSLLVPSAIGNTNSMGWKALKKCQITELETGISEKHFKVGTGISRITFTKSKPCDVHLINGVQTNRQKLPILPAVCSPIAISIFEKLTSFTPMSNWQRHYWTEFEKLAANKTIVGMSFLDRSKEYRLQSFEELNARNLKKVNICWIETKNVESIKRLMASELFSFYARQTMFSGNLQIGMVKILSIPQNWETLSNEQEIFNAYGITDEEIAYIKSH